ncbi:Asp23/Gls24 family envelope stress response protein [Ruficoccus amylovorans]|uniref:Asp23/Gls24 family envelope stress response protein n=1 Tax=Ruficoccus amylovorans TaxID=1804625 RepID=A0A842HJM1_9BACT|nr:Asp23/Gls24 family envelope stress response protein [Ruficoccus amylovorans]MBC2596320.1 Asp23/Gls24 family envelope stress response protein [Ruficoccus amylovorans]
MPPKQPSLPADEPDPNSIPVPLEATENSDEIHINIPVVANIVKMAALQVDGVYSVGGTFADGLWETLGAKKMDRGVEVREDEAENYLIQIHVEMRFGVSIASTAKVVQQAIRDQVEAMTSKGVAKVEVFVDGVRMEQPESARPKTDHWDHPHTD